MACPFNPLRTRPLFGNQAPIVHWNLAGFAQILIPLIESDAVESLEMAQDIINTFPAKFEAAYNVGIREDLGFQLSKEGPLPDGRPAHSYGRSPS